MKKRKCRFTPEEAKIHEEAVKLRKMTDKQLVDKVRCAEISSRTAETAKKEVLSLEHNKGTSDVEKLLSALAEGRVKGIKSGIAYKVSVLAKEMGLI